MKLFGQKGQSLVEALIALGAAAVIVSAISIAVIVAINNADFSKYQNLATYYAQQGIEVIRQRAQTDWVYFSTSSGKFCLNQDSSVFLPTEGFPCNMNINVNGNPFFIREVSFAPTEPPCASGTHASVVVKWTDGKCTSGDFCHDVTLESCFTNLDLVPTL